MPTADIIFIRDLKTEAQIGDFAWEQRIKQPVIFDVELKTNIRSAAASSQLTDTVDYAVLAQKIQQFVAETKFVLLETLAEDVASLILRESKAESVRLQVTKAGCVPQAKAVGIVIERP